MTRFAILGALALCALPVSASENVDFAAVDSDADGLISETEFISWKMAQGETNPADALVKFIEIDADGDGKITAAELAAAKDLAQHASPETERPN
ncbi:MAG: hypothetical protein AAFR51_08240 [Pseudomonadota bacterium]